MATQDRLPTGAGDFSDWTPLSGTSESQVDDPVGSPDDDTTYMSSADAEHNEAWTFPAFAITSSAISQVSVSHRIREASGEAISDSFLRVDGSYSIGNSFIVTGAYQTFTDDWLTNPNTGLAWTEAEVEGTAGADMLLQFGIRSNSMIPGDTLRCTQAYITVTYTAAASDTFGWSPIVISQRAKGSMMPSGVIR